MKGTNKLCCTRDHQLYKVIMFIYTIFIQKLDYKIINNFGYILQNFVNKSSRVCSFQGTLKKTTYVHNKWQFYFFFTINKNRDLISVNGNLFSLVSFPFNVSSLWNTIWSVDLKSFQVLLFIKKNGYAPTELAIYTGLKLHRLLYSSKMDKKFYCNCEFSQIFKQWLAGNWRLLIYCDNLF